VKIAICDNEKIYCDRLFELLEKYAITAKNQKFEIKIFSSGIPLLREYKAGSFDVVFLDVDMPDLSGFETAERIRALDLNVEIVFVTHLESEIYMGYRYGAKDYLCKPITFEQLTGVMDRIQNEQNRKRIEESYKIELKFGGMMRLPLADVLYFESQEHYIHAVIKDTAQTRHTFREQMHKVEKDLEEFGFVRIHQSYLVNKAHVFKDFKDHVLVMTGEKLPLSRKYKKTASEAFKGAWD